MMSSVHYHDPFTSTSNTLEGCKLLIDSLTRPPELDNVKHGNQRWATAVMAMAAHGAHQDSNHHLSDIGLHPLTVTHYSSGINAEATQDGRINHSRSHEDHLHHIRRLIFDLVTSPFDSRPSSTHIFSSVRSLIGYPGALHSFCTILVPRLQAQIYHWNN